MPELQYPFDPTGLAASNLIVDEQHPVTEVNFRDYFFIIPDFAPFFADNLVIKHSDLEETRILREGVDYFPVLPYVGATRSIGKPVYGGIALNSAIIIGIVSVTYQTLGGEWTANRDYIIERLAEKVYNPRLTIWDNITDKPNQFPPINHPQDFDQVYGQQALIDELIKIETAIATGRDQVGIVRHLLNFDNPHHTTLAQLGFDKLGNWSLATEEQAIEAISNDTLMTPFTSKAAILVEVDKLMVNINELYDGINEMSQMLNSHLNNRINPHQVTKTQVGLEYTPNLPLADDSEVSNKDTVDKLVTLKQVLNLLSNYSFNTTVNSNYSLIESTTSVNEGESVSFTVNTTNVMDGSVLYWTVLNETTLASDFAAAQGTVSIFGNTGTFTVTALLDSLTEDDEAFSVRLRTGSVTGPIVAESSSIHITNVVSNASYVVNTNSNNVLAGSSIPVTVVTTGVPDNTTIYWTIANQTTVDGDFATTSGNAVVNNNIASFNVQVNPNTVGEGDERFNVQVRLSSISGPIVVATEAIRIRASFSTIDMLTTCCIFTPGVQVNAQSLYVIGTK